MHPLIKVAGAFGSSALIAKALRDERRPEAGSVSDCSEELTAYNDVCIRLRPPQAKRLQEHRDANRQRIIDGLARAAAPSPVDFVPQGSYAIESINQEPDQHAGPDSRDANPRAVTDWSQTAVKAKSPDTQNGRQLRRMARKIALNRAFGRMPSGFGLTALLVEVPEGTKRRDEIALYLPSRRIRIRLEQELPVKHPVVGEIRARRLFALDKPSG